MELNFATVPFIILVVYVSSDILKNFFFKTDEDKKYIPPVAAMIGGIVGILVFLFSPESIGASNIVEACTSGMASGLAAVGCNQIYKQFNRFNNKNDEIDE